MPPIPTNESRSSLLGRTPGLTRADAQDFGAGTGIAIHNLGENIQGTSQLVGQYAKIKESHDADKWTNDSMTTLRDYYSKWVADPENNSKESFADDFYALASKSLSEYQDKAPSKIARQQFREQFQHFTSSHYAAAAQTSARTQVSNLVLSQENQNDSVVRSYQTNRSVPNLDANTQILSDLPTRFAAIDKSVGATSPELAKKLKNQLVEDAAYATMNYSPKTARKIIELGDLDGRRKHSLESQIQTAEDSVSSLGRTEAMNLVKNVKAQADKYRRPANLTKTDFQGLIPDDRIDPLVTEVNAYINTMNKVADIKDRITSWSGPEQVKYLNSLAEDAGKNLSTADEDATVLSHVGRLVQENIQWFQKDPAGYTIANNPAVKGLDDHIASVRAMDPKDKSLPALYARRDELLLNLQSPAGEGVLGDARKQHYSVDRAQLKVISNDEARAIVRSVNDSSPDEAVGIIASALASHPGRENIAFNNLVQLQDGPGLRGDYWLLYKNMHNIAANDLSGSLKWAKEAKSVNAELLSDVKKSLDAYGPWKLWAQAFPNDNYQMEGMLSGMKEGVISYALMQAQVGKSSVELAVKKSVDTWLYSEMAGIVVNGQTLLIDRQLEPGKPKMDDAQARNLGHNLGRLPEVLDPRSIDNKEAYFPTIWGPNGLGNEMTKWQTMKDTIVSRGYFKPAGDYATFYMRSDTGTDFEMRSKGKAIAVKLTDVPSFMEYRAPISMGQHTAPGGLFPVPNQSKPLMTEKTTQVAGSPGFHTVGYPGLQVSKLSLYDTVISTNWPVEPKYIRRLDRK